MRNLLLLLFLIPVLSTGCSTVVTSPTPSAGDLSLGSGLATGAEIPVQLQTSPVEMLRLQTVPPKVVPTPQVAPPPPPVTPAQPPPVTPPYTSPD